MAIFNSYVSLPEGHVYWFRQLDWSLNSSAVDAVPIRSPVAPHICSPAYRQCSSPLVTGEVAGDFYDFFPRIINGRSPGSNWWRYCYCTIFLIQLMEVREYHFSGHILLGIFQDPEIPIEIMMAWTTFMEDWGGRATKTAPFLATQTTGSSQSLHLRDNRIHWFLNSTLW